MNALSVISSLLAVGSLLADAAGEVGKRPYELDWANRTEDHCVPLVNFEDLTGWSVECKYAAATFQRSREQQIWGMHVGQLTYRGEGNQPTIRLLPAEPIPIVQSFDAVSLWGYGNNWGWSSDPKTPQVRISAVFADLSGREFEVFLYQVNWKEWYLMHKRLTPDQIERVQQGAVFKGLLLSGGSNEEDRSLYFDNLAVFTERFDPLQFEPRPQRGIEMLPGQSAGLNTGPGKLPFPTRTETILPGNPAEEWNVSWGPSVDGYEFKYTGQDGELVYRLKPLRGTWSDITAEWRFPAPPGIPPNENLVFPIDPCVGGGVYLQTANGPAPPDQREHLETKAVTGAVMSRWRLSAGGVSTDVTYNYRIWNKSLVIEVIAPGGNVAEVRFGRALELKNPRLVTNPFYPAQGGRPAVAISGATENEIQTVIANQENPHALQVKDGIITSYHPPLFLTGNVDWYVSNSSILWAHNSIEDKGVIYQGGTRYLPLTNGKRNDCFERFFITIAPRYEEALPNIPNPTSPWKAITGTRVWRAHGASNRQHDAQYWNECHRWGMTQVIVTDHETGWRDGGESFTFRTRTAPGKGGDRGQYDYARWMQDQLGFYYGPYNNYTDFAPVNEFWNFDMASRTSDNQLQHAWMRCYAPKPARAVEYCAKLAPQIEEKFHFTTAYCDVHTAVAPWHRVDYDPRVPGAGTFAAVFYAFGEIMLLQKQAWGGPVYSEGNYHCFYSGLTDGNYGQDQSYRPAENPWLVDFDLRKLHDLGCNFGMGNPGMFFAEEKQAMQAEGWLDRFLAATVAFGHPGFLTYEGGLQNALKSYYMLQQLHSRYCLAGADTIQYADAKGNLLDTSTAVASGAFKRSQVVTRYDDGTLTAANGSKTERMKVSAFGRELDLPPNGYAGWTEDGQIDVLSSDPNDHRCDYAVTPRYIFVDGRGKFARFPKAAGNGLGICRILPNNEYEILLHNNAECGFAILATAAIALDKERQELGSTEIRTARGLTYVMPVTGAFSYLLKK